MTELYELSISPPNLPYTILLGLMVVYWLTVIIGAIDLDFLDFDVDVDTDVDVDAEVDTEVEVDGEADGAGGVSGAGWFLTTASFFNLGSVPFMIFMSFLCLSLWVGSV
ncbi:MAG: hypothetical protein D6722_12680, partial [Bacteroidetes bacterium]